MGGPKERAETILDRSLRTTYHEQDGKTLIHTYQDVEPHLEYAKKCRREDRERRGKFGKRGEMHRTMSLPMNIIQTICAQYGLDFYQPEDAKKILAIARRDYPAFKTSE